MNLNIVRGFSQMKDVLKAVYPPLLMTTLSASAVIPLSTVSVALPIFPMGLATLFMLDTRARIKDYLYLKSLPSSKIGRKIIMRYSNTWCGRTVMSAVYPRSKSVYGGLGYRWYHIFPDKFFSSNSPVFKKIFWVSLFKGHKK